MSEFILDNVKSGDFHEYGKTITYHDPCHLKCGQQVEGQPRDIIKMIPGVQFKEMSNPGCCGFAGTFILDHFETSDKLAQQRAQAIRKNGADIVVTSCPACQMQLQRACREAGQEVEVMNLVQLVDHAMGSWEQFKHKN